MKRTPLRRGAAPKKRTPIKKRNPKRRQSEFARCYHSKARVEWVKNQPCFCCSGLPSENAHTETGGMGRKADFTKIVALCSTCHRLYDQHKYPFDILRARQMMKNIAAKTEKAWQATQEPEIE